MSTPTQGTIKKKMSRSRVHPDWTRPGPPAGPAGHTAQCCPPGLPWGGDGSSTALLPSPGTNWFPASQANSGVSLGREPRGHSANQRGDGSSTPGLLSDPCQHRSFPGPCLIPYSPEEQPGPGCSELAGDQLSSCTHCKGPEQPFAMP